MQKYPFANHYSFLTFGSGVRKNNRITIKKIAWFNKNILPNPNYFIIGLDIEAHEMQIN
jgi:hypothetical protein